MWLKIKVSCCCCSLFVFGCFFFGGVEGGAIKFVFVRYLSNIYNAKFKICDLHRIVHNTQHESPFNCQKIDILSNEIVFNLGMSLLFISAPHAPRKSIRSVAVWVIKILSIFYHHLCCLLFLPSLLLAILVSGACQPLTHGGIELGHRGVWIPRPYSLCNK